MIIKIWGNSCIMCAQTIWWIKDSTSNFCNNLWQYFQIKFPVKQISVRSFTIKQQTKTRTSQICIFTNEKQKFCTLCTCYFYFCTFPIAAVLDLFCGCVHLTTTFQVFHPMSKPFKQLNSTRISRTHFASQLTWNNREKISAETRNYIFRSRSWCRHRRRLCVWSLLSTP